MPFPVREAANRLLHALAMTSAGAAPAHVASQPTEDVDDLLTRGKALMAPLLNRLKAQEQCAEALRLFERATQLTPNNADAWANFGTALVTLSRHKEALVACDRALALDDKQAQAWAI